MTTIPLYDPLSPDMLRDPYPTYARMLEEHPVHWHSGMRAWVVVRHADCVRVLREHRTFARDPGRNGEKIPDFRQNVQMMDPPEQTPLRQLLVSAMRSQDKDRLFREAVAFLRGRLTAQESGEPFDWMANLAAPFALHMSAALLGVPEPDEEAYAEISHGIALRMDAGLAPENIPQGDAARKRLNELGESWFPRPEGDTGLIANLIRRADKEFSGSHYIRNSAAMMFNASYGTIFAMVGNAAYLLATDPGLLPELSRPSLVATGVDELIRYDGPAQGTSRIAVSDTTIEGTRIAAGDSVVTLLAAANRDPRVFADPDDIKLDRRPNPHLGFGSGPHACFGSEFGKLSITAVINALSDEGMRLRLAAEPTRRTTATVRSLDTLPVHLDQ
ncbi:cytochrome P450 [Kitasatospora sp. NPDC097691]|uniref:cytochrome P450 n=1 Tax=Kitasatospora sp. NPDC097691 TaxID=3157231 RepID=UPI00332C63ED